MEEVADKKVQFIYHIVDCWRFDVRRFDMVYVLLKQICRLLWSSSLPNYRKNFKRVRKLWWHCVVVVVIVNVVVVNVVVVVGRGSLNSVTFDLLPHFFGCLELIFEIDSKLFPLCWLECSLRWQNNVIAATCCRYVAACSGEAGIDSGLRPGTHYSSQQLRLRLEFGKVSIQKSSTGFFEVWAKLWRLKLTVLR